MGCCIHTDTESVLIFTPQKHPPSVSRTTQQAGYKATSLRETFPNTTGRQLWAGFVTAHSMYWWQQMCGKGIDVSPDFHVINFDIPQYSRAYIHRIGASDRPRCQKRRCLHSCNLRGIRSWFAPKNASIPGRNVGLSKTSTTKPLRLIRSILWQGRLSGQPPKKDKCACSGTA